MTNSKDPFYFNRVGHEKIKQGNYQGAIDDFTNGIRNAPDSPGYYLFRARAKEKLKDYKGSILDFKQAIEKDKAMFAKDKSWITIASLTFFECAQVESKEGLYKDAIASFNNALDKNNGNLYKSVEQRIYVERGDAKYELQDYLGAIDDFNKAIEGQDLSTKKVLGISYNSLGKVFNKRGLAQTKLGQYQVAIEDFNQAIQIYPDFPEAYGNRAFAKMKLGDKKGLMHDVKKAEEIQKKKEIWLKELQTNKKDTESLATHLYKAYMEEEIKELKKQLEEE